MKCSGETNLEGLRNASKYSALPNEREELFSAGWDIVKEEVEKLTSLGWAQDKKGNSPLKTYKGANIYFYLIHLAILVRNYLQEISALDQKCNSLLAEEKFKLNCVEENLRCLGKKHNTDYYKAWVLLTEAYGIDRQTSSCNDCCLGISEMIIDHKDDCVSFIIGDCDENKEPIPPYGEFFPCEFVIDEFTQVIGGNVHDNCN